MNIERTDSTNTQGTIDRQGNLATVTTPEGVVSIAYGVHLTRGELHVPAGVDGYSFEWADLYPAASDLSKAAYGNQELMYNFSEDHNLPLLAVDCSISTLADASGRILNVAEWLGALKLADMSQQRYTRREFIKLLLTGIPAVYLSSNLISSVSVVASYYTKTGENQSANLEKFSQRIHPESYIALLKIRDAVAAQKIHFLMTNQGYKHIFVTRGLEHVGLEDEILKNEQERLDYLTQLKPLLPAIVDFPETFYQIFEYKKTVNSDRKITNTWEEANLKRIMTGQ